MKNLKSILITLFAVFASSIFAQNLISNGGFENTTGSQPAYCTLNQASIPAPWNMRNSCDFYIEGSNPSGYCQAHTGIGFERFGATSDNSNHVGPYIYREYAVQEVTLTGGVSYKVEFWVKRDATGTDIKIGGHFFTSDQSGCNSQNATACSALNIQNPDISKIIAGNNQQYTKVFGCYTPPSSGVYYFTIGHFEPSPADGVTTNIFFLDDVSITPAGVGHPASSINMNSQFCLSYGVVANGGWSTNVDRYRWELWSQGGNTLLKKGALIEGQPNIISVEVFWPYMVPGGCYQLKLFTYQECEESVDFNDFCLDDANVSVTLTGSNPYCEGDIINFTASGDPAWTYTWGNGQNGQNSSIIATTGITSYFLSVMTTYGCYATINTPITVHPNNNIAPTTNGINNTGDFTYYVNANSGAFNFSIPSFDNVNEEVYISYTPPLPKPNPINTFNGNGASHETGVFEWNPGPTQADIGTYSFPVTVTDNNACGALSTPFTYNINVICEYCLLDIYYQDRHPNYRQLPNTTEAGRKIVAGYNVDNSQPLGDVETGTASVLFKAPSIDLEPGFTGGINFTAQIDPISCTLYCENCCESFSGFTHNTIPNVFTPNGDGYNDVWYVPDFQHQSCAFNAKEFTLIIKDSWGDDVYKFESGPNNNCCPFTSPSSNCSPCLPYPHSSIFWNGYANRGLSSGSLLGQGIFFWTLELKGCDAVQLLGGFTYLIDPQARMGNGDSIPELSELKMIDNEDLTAILSKEKTTTISEQSVIEDQLTIYPNPTIGEINISLRSSTIMKNGLIEILTLQGKVLFTKKVNNTKATIDVTQFAKGAYFIKLTVNNTIYSKSFIKE